MRFLIIIVLSFGLASAQDFPELTGRVVDAAGILSPQAEASLTQKLAAWEEQSSDQIVVVTVADLQGLPIERYGVELGRAWGIGVADGEDGRSLDNGALLIVAPNDRALRIEVGYGLEGTLTDALSDVIIRERIVPSFRSGDFNTGVIQGVDGMLTVLKGEEAEWLDRRRRAGERPVAESEGQFPWPLVIFIVIFVLPSIFRSRRGIVYVSDRKRRRRYGGNGDALAWIIASELAKGASRSGGWSSGGGGFGGGFSGGGGSFGGGGASGSW
ncbi:methanol dehydrogenase [Parvularcula sp. ZS-1/3]|uniref:Methanol dehydrogenase n=1 Tax=Parvularcula mediterranea TaxID=2732508 RepID=A0A7Y3W6D2_9PROT|nr:TPM domain-containing protein [Parvularcula mediterranea]NNU17227.1 methanol dehydrogenase [Parvularcula mediterranea]